MYIAKVDPAPDLNGIWASIIDSDNPDEILATEYTFRCEKICSILNKKKVVDISALKLALQIIANFNALNLHNVELVDNGVPINVTPEMIDNFKFTGLSNKDFVAMEWWNDAESIV